MEIIYITSEFNFYEKNQETLLTQFWVIIYITSEFNFYEKKHTLYWLNFWVIIYITCEFNFYEKKNRNFIDLILGNNLHNS